ncbi:MAG TPA: hypothetical protein VNU94_01025 [Acidobacteriaceae bacterium]|jgi:hypothetical protein|nr:hypothetical protein [Acidobacteriaceae bacterium]
MLFTATLYAQDIPAANPGRPTVSTPATLTPIGYLQFENGALYATDSQEFANQVGLSQVTKLTIAPRLQLLTNWQPIAYSNADLDHTLLPGDITLGAQAVVLFGKPRLHGPARPTVSLSYFGRAHEGTAPNLDIGGYAQSVLLLVSTDIRGFHIDTNAIQNEQVDDGSGVRRLQLGQTFSLSRAIGNFTVAGELWHFTQPLTHGNCAGSLWAVSYALRPNLVFDAGFDRGLTSTSTQWEGFTGFTYLLPHRLWPARGSHRL